MRLLKLKDPDIVNARLPGRKMTQYLFRHVSLGKDLFCAHMHFQREKLGARMLRWHATRASYNIFNKSSYVNAEIFFHWLNNYFTRRKPPHRKSIAHTLVVSKRWSSLKKLAPFQWSYLHTLAIGGNI